MSTRVRGRKGAGWPGQLGLRLCGLIGALSLGAACEPSTSTATPSDTPAGDGVSDPEAPRFAYPDSPRVDHVDHYHGIAVDDPYRWLEDLDAPQTRAWIDAQNEVTFAYLDSIPSRDAIRNRLTALWDYERWGVPTREGSRFIASKNDGLQSQAVLYALSSLDDAGTVLLDPNALSADGTVALAGRSFSPNGNLMAYGVSDSGSDWQVWRVRTVATAEDTSDLIQWI
ncbi:MAG: hypothetical protein AAF721_41530, partial [Myxococcota bacterium]